MHTLVHMTDKQTGQPINQITNQSNLQSTKQLNKKGNIICRSKYFVLTSTSSTVLLSENSNLNSSNLLSFVLLFCTFIWKFTRKACVSFPLPILHNCFLLKRSGHCEKRLLKQIRSSFAASLWTKQIGLSVVLGRISIPLPCSSLVSPSTKGSWGNHTQARHEEKNFLT